MNGSRIHRNMKIARSDSAIKLSYWDWCGLPLIHVAAKTISEQALSSFHSKGGWRSFWGLLHCDDQRLPWWASRDEPQHDCSRSDTDIRICMNFNISASLFILFIIPVLFCFVLLTRNHVYYMGVSCVSFLLPYISLRSNWAWKPSKLGLSISFSLWGFSSLLTL